MKNEIQNAESMAEIALRKKPHASIDRETARDILGKKLFGPKEWLSSYGIWFSDQQLKEIFEFPWNESILDAPCPFVKGKSIKETHFAFLGIDRIYNKPLTVLKWHELHPISGKQKPKLNPWYEDQDFARVKTCWFKWYLMLIKSAPNSTEKTYQEQTAMMPAGYRAPFAIEEVTKNILYHKTYGVYPNGYNWTRCQDIAIGDCHICVGDFIKVRGWAGGRQHPTVGISASRKNPYSKCRVIEP
ncbi:MAG: hypothetical protein NTZ84_00150 [Candidatus Nealsonbacteria bacterium]|nr:hypothetical protein [Candidatus Nealsonbacteria bacterium]